MRPQGHIKKAYLIALLCGGSAIPATGWTHWEGFEAADPATPAAVLTFDSAVSHYTILDARPLPWRALFDADDDTDTHSGNAGVAPQTPAITQR